MNYKKIYLTGVSRLKKAGIAEAKLDARLLLEKVCHTDRNTLLAHPELEVTSEQEKNYVNYIEARAAHNPLQYITGVQDFMGLEFYVNQNVLIPRQDTEILVEEVMPHVHDGMHILDMCTGSGCILISLLQYSNHCAGVGIDLSLEALEVAAQNAERILCAKGMKIFGDSAHWTFDCEELSGDEVYFVQGDLFAPLRQEKFDILVSNPPYIASAVIPTLEPEVAEHEPRMALDGKEDGLFFYKKIIASAGKYLQRGGMLFFEIGYDQGESVSALMADAGFCDIEVKKDYAGLDRVVFGTFLEDKNV
jgi:release factor glutamine methyltransferase